MKYVYRHVLNSAHRISIHNGNDGNLHGHSFQVIIEITGNIGKTGTIIDIQSLRDVIKKYDYATILRECRDNEDLIELLTKIGTRVILTSYEPTAENLAKLIAEEITDLEEKNAKSIQVQVDETPNEGAIYFGY